MTRLQERRGIDINLRSGPQMREYEAIADRIAADRPANVLDWGCGWGQVSALLAERGLDVSALDYRGEDAPDEVQPLERYPQIRAYVSSDPINLPYADGEFAAVLSCGVLEHVQDPDASLEELRRVLRPGGRFYVYKLPNRFSWLEAVARVAGLYYHGKLPDDRIYTKRSAVDLLRRHGFAVEEAKRTNVLPLTIDHPWFARNAERLWRLNVGLARLPLVNFLATNVEVIARAP